MLVAALTVVTIAVAGCQQGQKLGLVADPGEASAAYERGDFTEAFDKGKSVARYGERVNRPVAAYIAGMSARRLGDDANALRFLRQAATTTGDTDLAADAWATLGILYSERGEYSNAAHALLRAAERYTGEDQARAYFHAAIAQQKLGRWPQARTNLILARAQSDEPGFWQRVTEQLNVTGYTIQTGAFRERANARRAAEDLARRARTLGLPQPRLVDSTDTRGSRVTLVQVGEFATFASARATRDRLGAIAAVIVPLAGE